MNCIKETLFIFSLFNIFYIQHVFGGKEIVDKGTCADLFERSVVESIGNTPHWNHNPSEKTCSICQADNQLRSWLLTRPFETKDYESIHAGVQMSKTNCEKCKNQRVKAYILYNSPRTPTPSPTEMLGNLTLVAILANKEEADYEFHNFSFEPEKSKFSLVLLSEGSCTRIKMIEISAFVCEKNTIKGVNLTRTISPATGFKRKNATCIMKNALNLENAEPYGLCSSNGTWDVQSPCKCKRGFTIGTVGYCVECGRNTYKSSIGNEKCTPCPNNSASEKGQTQCQCNDGSYRLQGENYEHPCYGIPSEVTSIKFVGRTETTITLQWQQPQKQYQGAVYEIECNKCPLSSDSAPCEEQCGRSVTFIPSQTDLKYTNVTIRGLEQNTEYQFVIYSKNKYSDRINKTNWKNSVKKIKTEAPSSKSDGLDSTTKIAVAIVVIILTIVIFILIFCLFKRRRVMRYRASLRGRSSGVPLVPGEKNYIDPTTYDNPERAVSEFAKELDRNAITFETIIGGGEFGDVYKGELKLPGQPATKVAIKKLKAGASHKNRTDFLIEASVMGQFKNLNVISLEGVVTKTPPLLIVIEYMENGSLDGYLKENDGKLKPLQLLRMARGVANGMEYLAGMHFVHRDLAARNVLVNANLACKVADFGLSRDIGKNEDSEYETQGGKIPVRWTAPEAITFRKFSTASDIWSYGILLWEIMSFAERPYWSWGNEEVMERVSQGYRLPAPMHCPKTVHQLMTECWKTDRTKRPAFKEIVRIIDEWIQNPEKLNEDYIKVRRNEPLDYSTFTSVKDWLEAIKMGMYASNFSKAGYEELSDVAQLTEDELLKKVGVRLIGHRHKIYQRIKEMSEEMKLKREQSMRI
ncbi:ephrin type-B receptor 2-like [Dendronephthya gigantea]|uniref:ephrin type-B receptor 2-like n=1 Tax=Dendronephthya gigantea TaxID=151771 RepID=UPI00106CC021|nr:ephrin type-B receptor 2-like [Dendronephthya gigantea]